MGEKFDRLHEQEFSKMESIASYAAKRESPQKKRKSSAMDGRNRRPAGIRASGAKAISNGRRKIAMPGGFGEDEDEDEDEDKKASRKKPRVEDDIEPEGAQGKIMKVSIALPISNGNTGDEKEEHKKKKEREAIRRKLEMNKARRRSSMGRVSIGGGKAPPIPNRLYVPTLL